MHSYAAMKAGIYQGEFLLDVVRGTPVGLVERSAAGDGFLRLASSGRGRHREWARFPSLIRPESLRRSWHGGVHSSWIQDGSRIATRPGRIIAESRHRKSNQAAQRTRHCATLSPRFHMPTLPGRWPLRWAVTHEHESEPDRCGLENRSRGAESWWQNDSARHDSAMSLGGWDRHDFALYLSLVRTRVAARAMTHHGRAWDG